MPCVSYAVLEALPEGEINSGINVDDFINNSGASDSENTDETKENTGNSGGGLGYDGIRTPEKKQEEESYDTTEDSTEEETADTPKQNPCTDVNDSDWFLDDVMYAYENGIMSGVSEIEFSPKSVVTRGMVITILHRTAGTPEAKKADFVDVADSDWYAKAVSWGAENGIVSGTGDGQFSPVGAITREQLAVMLYNYRKLTTTTDKKAELSAYADKDNVSAWAEEAVRWAVGNGIINGKSADTIAPKDGATRAEAAAIIRRFMGMVDEQ